MGQAFEHAIPVDPGETEPLQQPLEPSLPQGVDQKTAHRLAAVVEFHQHHRVICGDQRASGIAVVHGRGFSPLQCSEHVGCHHRRLLADRRCRFGRGEIAHITDGKHVGEVPMSPTGRIHIHPAPRLR